MPQVQRLRSAIPRCLNLLIISAVISLLVANINCQNSYETSELADPGKQLNRGHEVVLVVPKYNIKITSTIKDDGQQGGYHPMPMCNCGQQTCPRGYEGSFEHRQDSNPWPSYEPAETDVANIPMYLNNHASYNDAANTDVGNIPMYLTNHATHHEPVHIQPLTVYRNGNQAETPNDPLVGSSRSQRQHKQNTWFYSAPAWISEGSPNMNILRSADPRALIHHSHSHTVVKTKPTLVRPLHKHGLSVHKSTKVLKFRDSAMRDERARAANRQVDNRYIGSHMFAAPRWRRDTGARKKRGVLEFLRLVGDHEAKIDMSRTAENVGAATKNVFENDKSPVYHLRNFVGSSQDALMSMIGSRPRGVIIPSRYRIVPVDEAPVVGAINPGLYAPNGPHPSQDQDQHQDEDDEQEQYFEEGPGDRQPGTSDPCQGRSMVAYDDTFSRVGAILRNSMQQTHKTAEHFADAVHSARQVIATARKYWPKILLPYAGAVEIAKNGQGADIVGSAQDPQFVGIGRIMDYFGITGEKPENEPRLGSTRQVSEEEQLLNRARSSLGTTTYRQFMDKMKKELGRYQRLNPIISNSEQVGSRLIPRLPLRPRPVLPRIPRPIHRPLPVKPNLSRLRATVKLPPKPVLKPVKGPNPALLRLRETLKAPPKLEIKTDKLGEALANLRDSLRITSTPERSRPVLPKLRDSLLSSPRVDPKDSPVLAKLRESLKLPAKAEPKLEKPLSPALAKLRESIALRKAGRKSPLLGKSRDEAENNDQMAENDVEPKAGTKPGVITSPILDYSEEDLDKSLPDPHVAAPPAKPLITSPNLDDSDENLAEHVKSKANSKIITSPNLDDSEENADKPSPARKKEPNSALDRLRAKQQDKRPANTVDNGDLLGRALEILRNKAQRTAARNSKSSVVEGVGATPVQTPSPEEKDDVDNDLGSPHGTDGMKFAAVPLPIFTKEMKTPFMGFASKTDLDDYFKKLYCTECKKARDADSKET